MCYPCMMFRWSFFSGLLLAFALQTTPISAQDGISRKKQERIQAKKEKQEVKDKARKEKQDRKRHLSIQDKETRKRIKRHTRRSHKHGTGTHRDGFPRNLFQKRR